MRETPAADSAIPRLELPSWQERFGVTAGLTTRGPAGDYSLPLWSAGAPAADVLGRWSAFRASFGGAFPALAFGRQVHGNRVALHDGPGEGMLLLEGYDGHATARPGLLLAVSVADCVPVYLATRTGNAVALLHAGWRGTAAGILERGVTQLSGVAQVPSGDIVMHCGVAICGDCYEVGSDVYESVTGRKTPGPARLDLRAELALQGQRLGVGEITVSPWCTAHDRDRFHSHRATGGNAGRMIAYLGIPASTP